MITMDAFRLVDWGEDHRASRLHDPAGTNTVCAKLRQRPSSSGGGGG